MIPSVQSILGAGSRTCSWELQIGDLCLRSAGPADTEDMMARLPEIEAMAARLGRGQPYAPPPPGHVVPGPIATLSPDSTRAASPAGHADAGPNASELPVVAAESRLGHQAAETVTDRAPAPESAAVEVVEPAQSFLNVFPAEIDESSPTEPVPKVPAAYSNGQPKLKSTQLSFLADLHLLKYDYPRRRTSTINCIRTVINLFIAVVGDKRAEDVDFVDMERFAATLLRWPVRVHKIEGFADLDFPAILEKLKTEQTEHEALELATCNKYIQHLSAWFNVIKEWGPREDNPVLFIDRKRFTNRHGQMGSRRSYRPPEIRKVMDPVLMASYTAPHKYWTKLISYYTGMRVRELSQLYRTDVQYLPMTNPEGVTTDLLCLLIAETEPGQSVKTEYGTRIVPVPPQVLELGFERYLADLDRLGARHLFPGLPWGEAGPGDSVSKWFNHELRTRVGITDPALTFHCMRNHIVTVAAHNMVPEFVMDSLCGHSPLMAGAHSSGTKVRGAYRDAATPLQIFDYLGKMPFPAINVPAYNSAQFDHHLRHETARDRRNIALVKDGKPPMVRRGRVPKTIHTDLLPYVVESGSGAPAAGSEAPPLTDT
jgi:integrase